MTEHKINGLVARMASLALAGMLLYSCSGEDIPGTDSGNSHRSGSICFNMTTDEQHLTRSAADSGTEGLTTWRMELRSLVSDDTLCMRSVVTDGICPASPGRSVTRATPVTSLDTYSSFHVLAYLGKGDGSVNGQFYMDEQASPEAGLWQTEKTYYWPGKDYSLQFRAWAPEGAFASTPSTPQDTRLSYTVPAEVSRQQDLLVATTASLPGNSNEIVPLNFKHICTAVRFQTGSEIQPGTIKSVSLKGVQYKGTYDMATSQWTLDSETYDFQQDIDKAMTGSEQAGSEVTAESGTFMMLPQTLPTGASVEVVFHDNITGTDRTLSGPIAGMEWPMGKTVTYRLSITPEYKLEFTQEPQVQDAHYIIYPIHIKANNLPNGWTLTSPSSSVTLRKDLTDLEKVGYWIEEDRGTQSISGTETGSITVYAFLEENATEADREIKLSLSPTGMDSATPATFTIRQLCPSWNGTLGCERIEEGDYPWGFLWDSSMKVTYDMTNTNWLRRLLISIYLRWFTSYPYLSMTTEGVLDVKVKTVTIDFSKVPTVDVAESADDGHANTTELYNFNGVSDASAIMNQLESWGGKPDKTMPGNPDQFAAKACVLKNKFNKETTSSDRETVERPVLKEENLVWYLPARNEASQMQDDGISGNYWTSTASDAENDNENAYKYSAGASTSLNIRTDVLHVRAVRKHP